MKKWYIALFAALIILAGCGTEDDGTMDEETEADPQGEVTTEDDQSQGEAAEEIENTLKNMVIDESGSMMG